MALQQQGEEDPAFFAAYEDDTPTPAGWKRKLVPRIGKSMVPVQTDVIFITPSGEEFKSRAQLQRYLKTNKGGPSLSEFIWIVDGTPERSTRSKSTPMGKLEIPARADSKKKPTAAGNRKRRGTSKTQKPEEDMSIVKGKHSKNMDMDTFCEGKDGSNPVSAKRNSSEMDTLCEGRDEGVELIGSSPTSAKRKRSAKVRAKIDSAPTLMDSANTNGVADTSYKGNKTDETVKKTSFNKANKRTRSKGRTMTKKGQDKSDDVRQEADVGVDADVSSAGATEPDANGKDDGDHPEEGADVDQSNATTAVNE